MTVAKVFCKCIDDSFGVSIMGREGKFVSSECVHFSNHID